MAMHSIRSQLPFTAQTDPNQFPAIEYAEYPKMLLVAATKEDVDAWAERNRNVDEHGKVSFNPGRIRVGQAIPFGDELGEATVVHSREEEEDLKRLHMGVDFLDPVAAPSAAGNSQVARLEKENEALQARIAALEGKDAPETGDEPGEVSNPLAKIARPSDGLPPPINKGKKK